MEFFIDTANIDEIRKIKEWGIISGVTTNPKIMSTEKEKNYRKIIEEILHIIDGPVSVEVTTNEFDKMIEEAMEYASWHKNIVIKIPMNVNGVKAMHILKNDKIKINATVIVSPVQALVAAMAGATYASIFYGRVKDLGYNAAAVVSSVSSLFKQHNFKTKIIVGSVRHMMDIYEAAAAGADIITIPTKFFELMVSNPQTDKTIDEFLRSWAEYRQK